MDLIEIARLEEARQVRAVRESGVDQRPFGGGVATRAHPGSFMNQAVGVGLDGPVAEADLDDLIAWYEAAGSEPRLEVTQFVDPGLLAACGKRRFVVRSFEVVFFRELSAGQRIEPVFAPPAELEIRTVAREDESALRAHAVVASSGFYPDGEGPSEDDLAIAIGFARKPRSVCVNGSIGGRIVGAGSCEVNDGGGGGIVALFGLSVLPEFRRRGVQQALIAARLNLAIARGCTLATIGGRPGAATERNVRRMGFQAAYTKVILVRPGPGLTPAMG